MSTTASATETDAPESSRGKLLIGIALLIVAAVAGGSWFFVIAPAASSEPKPGEVVPMEAMQVNLAGGHYLRLGLALQLTETAHKVDGSKALDAAISVFSGRPIGEVNKPAVRERLRHRLTTMLEERYHGEVMEVYFTEYVTQ